VQIIDFQNINQCFCGTWPIFHPWLPPQYNRSGAICSKALAPALCCGILPGIGALPMQGMEF
jgi:hypothetical protein